MFVLATGGQPTLFILYIRLFKADINSCLFPHPSVTWRTPERRMLNAPLWACSYLFYHQFSFTPGINVPTYNHCIEINPPGRQLLPPPQLSDTFPVISEFGIWRLFMYSLVSKSFCTLIWSSSNALCWLSMCSTSTEEQKQPNTWSWRWHNAHLSCIVRPPNFLWLTLVCFPLLWGSLSKQNRGIVADQLQRVLLKTVPHYSVVCSLFMKFGTEVTTTQLMTPKLLLWELKRHQNYSS